MMTVATKTDASDIGGCEARSGVYQTFAGIFTRPDEALWAAFENNHIQHRLQDLQQELPFNVADGEMSFCWDTEYSSLEDLSVAYTSAFEVGNAPVSLYGRSYSKASETELFEELFRFYEYFGLDFNKAKILDWPDSIVTELDFMHYLSFIEANQTGDSTSILRAQKDFLERHLSRFVEGFGDAVADKGPTLYMKVGEALKNFIAADLAFLTKKAAV
jgi:DMSO reductase family type II enzyme chaperone